MTQAEWLTCTDPTPMLEFLEGKDNARKRHLLAGACCWYISGWIGNKESQEAIEEAERYADGLANDHKENQPVRHISA